MRFFCTLLALIFSLSALPSYSFEKGGLLVKNAASVNSLIIDTGQPIATYADDFKAFTPEFFCVASIDIQADVPIHTKELEQLLAIVPGQTIAACQLQLGCATLIKKGKFKTITIHKTYEENGIALRIVLGSMRTLGRVSFSGSIIGKDKYKSAYLIGQGDPFITQQHELSLKKIQQTIQRDGYLDAQITDSLICDENSNSVRVNIHIDQGPRFVVGDIVVKINTADTRCAQNCVLLQSRICKQFERALVNRYYTKKAVEEETKRLHAYLMKKGYGDTLIELEEAVDYEQEKIKLTLSITLRHKNVFEFYGNLFFNRAQLLDRIFLFGKSITLIPPSLVAQEIKSFYKQYGFLQTQVHWQEDDECIFFFIHEGIRTRIVRVCFEGTHSVDSELLIERYFSSVLKKEYLDEDAIKEALDALTNHYRRQGFWDFKIVSSSYAPQAGSSQQYDLMVEVFEGKQQLLSGVTIESNVVHMHEPCFTRYYSLPEPIPFDVTIIQEQRQALVKRLQEGGRLHLTPYPTFVTHDTGALQLAWKFKGSDQVMHFGKTVMVGNSRIPPHILLRELTYKESDIWNRKQLEASAAQLKGLGIFDAVSLTPDDISVPESHKMVLLRCVEDTPFELRTRVGVQGVNRHIFDFKGGVSYKLGGSFLVKNPCNRADLLRLDLDFSRYAHDVIASYKIPWYWRQPLRAECKVYSCRYDQPIFVGSPCVLYKSSQDGFLVSVSQPDPRATGAVNVGVDWIGIAPNDSISVQEFVRAVHIRPDMVLRKIPYFFVEPTFFMDRLDNKMDATRGTLSVFSLKGMIPHGLRHAACAKLLFEQSYFRPVMRMMVLALRLRCGTVLGTHFDRIMPIERFYLGGAYTVRSYEPDFVPPLNPITNKQGKTFLVPTGGRSMFNANIELRFPIYKSLKGVLFTDIGMLSKHGFNVIQPDHVVGAVGFGLRLATLVGPLRFDIGWKFKKNEHASGLPVGRSFAWFLTLGNAF